MIRIINKPFLFILISAGIILGSSCKKSYLDVNNDPNRVTDANVTAELIFTQAENAVGAKEASGNFLFLDEWMGYLAPNGTFVPQQNIITYNIDFTFGDALFTNHYGVLFDLHQAEVKGLATGDTVLAGASIILSAKLFQELVDLYGNIPYSQAFQVNTYKTPAYDKAQDIYAALQLRLDTAINYMEHTAIKAFGPSDIIKVGPKSITQAQWIKFANTLKLRLLIRQSEVTGFNPSADITKIQTKGGVLGAGESISVNPGYVNDVNKQNPYFANNGWTAGSSPAIANNSTDANNYIINILESRSDPRESRFFYPKGFTGSTFVGNVFGDPIGTLQVEANSSYFGPALVGNVNIINGTAVPDGSGATKDQWIYPSYESMFLYAEAVARGWIAGDANAALAAAITESFVWLGVPDAATAATDYITNNPDIATITTGSVLDNAKIIAYQKYIANTAIDPLESFLDQNRLHFLTDNSYISTISSRLSDFLPVRLLYPQVNILLILLMF